MTSYIVSPKSGKMIIVDGPTYNQLLKTSYASAVKKAKVVEKSPRSTHQRQYGKTTTNVASCLFSFGNKLFFCES